MAHLVAELDRPMYGSNKPAWHGLGTVVAGQPTSEEAIRYAGLDWSVSLEDFYTADMVTVPGHKLTVRTDLPGSDARRVLGVVRDRYTPIQNADAFVWADQLVGGAGARFESAGSLKNGRIVWLLAQLPEEIRVKDDTVAEYLLITTSHDGSKACQVLLTPIRVVCWNTLSLALNQAAAVVSIKHTASAGSRLDEARRVLGLARRYFEAAETVFNRLADVRLSDSHVRALTEKLIPNPPEPASDTRARNARAEVLRLYHGGQQGARQDAVLGTAYGFVNAVAEYVDHVRNTRGSDATARQENRFESIHWGSAADMKRRALELTAESVGLELTAN